MKPQNPILLLGLTLPAVSTMLIHRPAEAPTWYRDVSPIIRAKCAACHREGEIGPFSLLTHEDNARRAKQISEVVERKLMPPWKADSHGVFKGERRLTPDEIETIRAWAQNGAPAGEPQSEIPVATSNGWRLGMPDKVVRMPEPYTVKGDSPDVYRCFVLPNDLVDDAWISAVEVKPGNPKIVHHVNLFVDRSGTAERMDAADPEPGFKSNGFGPGFPPNAVLGGWTPGRTTGHLPEGVGTKYPSGGKLVIEIHYHSSGKTEVDQTSIGIHFSKSPVKKRLRVLSLMNNSFRIPPNDRDVKVKILTYLQTDITVLDVTPHMHFLGKSMSVWAATPNAPLKKLVHVGDWDYRWQTVYEFLEPLKLPRGSRFEVEAHYDNTRENPRNPHNPPKWIAWGEAADQEMCTAFIGFTVDAEDLIKGTRIGKIHPMETGVDFL